MTKETVFLGKFEHEMVFSINLYQRALIWKNKIVFVPSVARDLCIYDPREETFEYVKLHNWEKATGIDCFLEGDNLWICYAYKSHFVLKINLESREVVNIKSPDDSIYSDAGKHRKTAFWSGVAFYKDKLYIPLWQEEHIVCLDTKSDDYRVIKLPMKGLQLASIAVFDGKIYFTSYKDWNVYCYDMGLGRIKTYAGTVLGNTAKGFLYPLMITSDNGLYIFPEVGNSVLTIKDNALVKAFDLPNDFERISSDVCNRRKRFYGIVRCSNEITIPPYCTNRMLTFDVESGECRSTELLFDNDYIEEMFKNVYKPAFVKEQRGKDMVTEGRFYTLSDFLSDI